MKRGRFAQAYVELVSLHGTETFRRRTIPCIRKFPVLKNFIDKKGGTTIFCRLHFVTQY